MAKPVVFVIGATGSIGAATVTELANKYADKLDIRAGVRNPEKADKLKALPGVRVVQAEMGPSPEKNLVETLKGVHTLYINTPGAEKRAPLAIATAEAAKSAGVKHIVVVSIFAADHVDNAFGSQFHQIESAVKDLGVPYTILRLPLFYDNFFGLKDEIKSHSSISSPVDPTKPFASIASEDAGKAGAVILADPSKHVNKTYKLVSDRHTYNDLATAFSAALGREIKYVRLSYEDAMKGITTGFPEWRAQGIVEFFKNVDNEQQIVIEAGVDDFTQITGEKPTDLKTWVNLVAEAFK